MWDMPWTDSETLIERRTDEEFLKRGEGDRRVEFSIPINWIDILDIFTNFRLQEPFGLDGSPWPPDVGGVPAEERGEYGRYYYIESLTYDFMHQKINIVGIDLQYLLRQCMIIAHCGDVAEKWENASESDKMYAYVGNCDAGSFVSDGTPLKKVCNCITA